MKPIALPGLKQVRRERGKTLRDLSEDTGIGVSTISDIENLKRRARLETARQLSWGLDTSIYELTGGQHRRPTIEGQRAGFSDAYEMATVALLLDDKSLRYLHYEISEEMHKRGMYVSPIRHSDVFPKDPRQYGWNERLGNRRRGRKKKGPAA
jgi:transcriptional regulator with XRE-family HTH domain